MSFSKVFAAGIVAISMSAYAAADQGRTINAFYYDESDPFIYSFSQAFKSEVQARGYTIEDHDAQLDFNRQLDSIHENFAKKSPMLVNLLDPHFASDIIQSVRSYDGRVVFFNRIPDPGTVASYKGAWYVGGEPIMAGAEQANVISDYVKSHPQTDRNGDGVIGVLVLKGEPTHDDTTWRTSKVLLGLRDAGLKVKVVDSEYCMWSYDKAAKAISDLRSKNGNLNGIELIISNNDAMALGAVKELQHQGYNSKPDSENYIPVFGIDGIPDAIKATEDGSLAGTVAQDYQTMAVVSAMLLTHGKIDLKAVSEFTHAKMNGNTMLIPYKGIRADFWKNFDQKKKDQQ